MNNGCRYFLVKNIYKSLIFTSANLNYQQQVNKNEYQQMNK